MSNNKTWTMLKNNIDRGLQGLNTGIPFHGFGTFSDYICNIQQGRYDLIFAGTGIGKTAFVNSTYVFGAIEYMQRHPEHVNDLEIIYYSLEITPELQIAKLISARIWNEHGILTTVNEILSRGNNRIRPEVLALIEEYEEDLNEIQSKYLFFRASANPEFVYTDIVKYAKSRGRVTVNSEGDITAYKPANPNLITLIVIDHAGLISKGKHKTLKEAIDQTSKHLVFFRNMFNFSPVVISQINRGSEQMDRRDNGDNWMPMLSDIKDTGGLSEDANTVIGIASPFYLQVDKCLGFDITRFKDRYRLVKICKNRDGESNLLASFLFIGEIGQYTQLNKSSEYEVKAPEELQKINQYYRSISKEK
jgi:hypothetical protein